MLTDWYSTSCKLCKSDERDGTPSALIIGDLEEETMGGGTSERVRDARSSITARPKTKSKTYTLRVRNSGVTLQKLGQTTRT